jgi:hypothetical protein
MDKDKYLPKAPKAPKVPKEVKERIDVLNTYKINNDLKSFNIIHIYPKENAFPNGYYDSKFFTFVGFNFESREKRIIEQRDGVNIDFSGHCNIMFRCYVDGSFMVKFPKPVTMLCITQDLRLFLE